MSTKLSIHWPTLLSQCAFGRPADVDTLAVLIRSAADRVGVEPSVDPVDTRDVPELNGSLRSIIDAVNSIEKRDKEGSIDLKKGTVDQEDLDGLSQCLWLLDRKTGVAVEQSTPVRDEIVGTGSPDSSKKKKASKPSK